MRIIAGRWPLPVSMEDRGPPRLFEQDGDVLPDRPDYRMTWVTDYVSASSLSIVLGATTAPHWEHLTSAANRRDVRNRNSCVCNASLASSPSDTILSVRAACLIGHRSRKSTNEGGMF